MQKALVIACTWTWQTTLGSAISIPGLETSIIVVATLARSNSIHSGGEQSMNERKGHHDTHQHISRCPDEAMENNLPPRYAISIHGCHKTLLVIFLIKRDTHAATPARVRVFSMQCDENHISQACTRSTSIWIDALFNTISKSQHTLEILGVKIRGRLFQLRLGYDGAIVRLL